MGRPRFVYDVMVRVPPGYEHRAASRLTRHEAVGSVALVERENPAVSAWVVPRKALR